MTDPLLEGAAFLGVGGGEGEESSLSEQRQAPFLLSE